MEFECVHVLVLLLSVPSPDKIPSPLMGEGQGEGDLPVEMAPLSPTPLFAPACPALPRNLVHPCTSPQGERGRREESQCKNLAATYALASRIARHTRSG